MIVRFYYLKYVGYVFVGRDVIVLWGGFDFKFINNKDYFVIIKVYVNVNIGVLMVDVCIL